MRSDAVVLRTSGDASALDVFVAGRLVGSLFKPESEPDKYHFAYAPECPPPLAVSLSMPVVQEHYASAYKALHPVFDMNLPEGALADRLRREFSKVVLRFDALALLRIVGRSQIGRLRFAEPGQGVAEVPAENLSELLAHDGAHGLFESLLSRYAVYSGISGAMPKVLVRDDKTPRSVTHRGATHIVKAWGDEYPQLAENEFFCMRAAWHARLPVPALQLSRALTRPTRATGGLKIFACSMAKPLRRNTRALTKMFVGVSKTLCRLNKCGQRWNAFSRHWPCRVR